MKNLTTLSAAFLIICLLIPSKIVAQEEMQQKKLDNVTWKEVVYIDFKPGMMGQALEIIEKYFRKASTMANTSFPDQMIEMRTGPWDMVLVWTMKGGIEDMNWDVSPDNIKWRKALNKIAEEEGKTGDEVWNNYMSMVARSSSNIGMSK
ncbi:hypothetical protein [Marinigracilibium pacificum]|uniref:NIPSNAP domain-containing protein n=1 Tax=Marinigracilibium pacificum TaxID=2729599 RepID=A0A848IY53_9BACT|nr:hypothetical protein [Marinigracilibium pacificum]NMM48566.1 hypothetical protein [Marinigracilibium pacificum]